MFAIAVKQEQYKTYVLSDQTSESQMEVVPERGGIITSWRIKDREILYLDVERFSHPELSVRGGIPILFPICGNLPNNTYTHQGQQYSLKQHGFARDLPWQVTEMLTQDIASLTLTLTSNEQTRAVYPFDFQIVFTYQLQGNLLQINQSYTNKGADSMPFSTGLHPYFWVTDKTQLQFEIPSRQYLDQIHHTRHDFTGTFDFDSDEIDVAFGELTSQSATVTDLSRQLQLRIEYDRSYSALVFWTIKGKNYYCLEPWSALRNALNTGDRLIYLEPGATCETQVRLSAQFLA